MPDALPFDAFLSHASPDKDWVKTLQAELTRIALNAYLDVRELKPGDNFVLSLDGGLRDCRFLILIVSQHTVDRQWVLWEWTTFMADRGPLGRIIPVRINDVALPHALLTAQAVHAVDRDAARVADQIADRIRRGPAATLGDLYYGQHFLFALTPTGDELLIRDTAGSERFPRR